MKTAHPGSFTNGARPIHPGEVLREDFMVPLGMTVNAFAKTLRVSITAVDDIGNERRPVTAELAMRLERYFGIVDETWLNLQQACDLKVARRVHGQRVEAKITPREAHEPSE